MTKIVRHSLNQHLTMNATIEDDQYQLNEVWQVRVMISPKNVRQ